MKTRSSRLAATAYAALGLVLTVLIPLTALADISGTVFQDFDADGVMDSLEPGVSGITVSAYQDGDAAVATTTTDSSGAYTLSLSSTTKLRVEFTGLNDGVESGAVGASSLTSVVTADDGETVDFGVNRPANYCQAEPEFATPCYISDIADFLNPVIAAQLDVLVKFPFDAGTDVKDEPAPTHLAIKSEMGTVWGLAYQRSSETLFASALMKRHCAFIDSPGTLYSVDLTAEVPGATSVFVDLETVLPASAGFGTDPHPFDTTNFLFDPDSWDPVGKRGFGDIDISEDEETLYAVNLNSRELLEIEIGVPAEVPTIEDINRYPIPAPPDCSATANQDWRPFALAVYNGKVYVGGVCSAESTVTFDYTTRETSDANYVGAGNFGDDPDDVAFGDPSELSLAVWSFEPEVGFDSTPVLTAPLNFPRLPVTLTSVAPFNAPPDNEGDWNPWVPQFTVMADGLSNAAQARVGWAQPMLSDIEFDWNGDMILGLVDRAGHQLGGLSGSTDDGSDGTGDGRAYIGFANGDVYRACLVNGTYEMEGNGTCGSNTSSGAGNGDGPLLDPTVAFDAVNNPSGEYYAGDSFDPFHFNLSVGGLAQVRGQAEVHNTIFDPADTIFSGGIRRLNNSTGEQESDYVVFDTGNPGTFGKVSGLGDLEPLCDPAPVEIGNYIWFDSDSDGIQDPDESVATGVTVELYNSSCELVATAITDTNGQYYFVSSNSSLASSGEDYVGVLSGSFERDGTYFVVLASSNFDADGALAGFVLTTANATSSDSSGDIRDSDAEVLSSCTSALAGIQVTVGAPGQNNHTFDIGLVEPAGELEINQTDAQLESDGLSNQLAASVRRAIRTRSTQFIQGNCTSEAKSKSKVMNRVDSLRQENWQTIWGLPSVLFSSDDSIVEPLCTLQDFSAEKTTILSNLRKIRNIGLNQLKVCSESVASRLENRIRNNFRSARKEVRSGLQKSGFVCGG